jgi:hypothetical protein
MKMFKSFAVAFLLALTCCMQVWAQNENNSINLIESHFRQIPDEQKLAVYWYWMSDNISKEGVVKDLKAMKKAGINRAYIGNIFASEIPRGKVKIFSTEWWGVLHTALKTATELNIEIGLFNCPGWSQSGGPWIKPSQSMRYLASSQVRVKGPLKYHQLLPSVGSDAQDVRVIAYPDIQQTCSFVPQQDLKSAYKIDLISKRPSLVRSITIQTEHKPHKSEAELFVKENGTYRSLCKFEIDRSNAANNVGFEPYAPIVISLPETKASEFRLIVDKNSAGMIESINLSNVPRVERYPEKTLAKMFQTPHPMWYDYMWRNQPFVSDSSAIVPSSKVIDITSYMKSDGTLTWNVPQGNWVIMRSAMVTTGQTNAPASPEGTGLEVDKMSAKHVAAHFDAYLGQILKRIPAEDRKTFKIVVEDSYETGGLNWTDTMIDDFTNRYGYSPVPYIPVLQGVVVGSEDKSDRFLWDLRRLIADKVSYEYVGGLKKVSNKYGLTTWLENYGHWGFPGEFLQYGGQSDEIAGEFWSVGDLGDIENKASSSCGHIYGKTKVWAESFTCGGPDFSRYPGEMKKRGDRFFTEGINSTLLHLYIQQPDEKIPGYNAPYGNEFNRHNTWFSQLDVFAKYLKRCNYMLQQGRYIADVAYFIGEDAPKMTGIRVPEIPKGYSFDYINAEVLLDGAHIVSGKLTLRCGMQYHVLVLPQLTTMRPEVLSKIKELVNDGLVIIGPAPTHSPSLQNYPSADEMVKNMADELWHKSESVFTRCISYGRGKVYPVASLEEVFADMNLVPDFQSADPCNPLLYIHRRTNDSDIYFVSNQSEKTVSFDASFRVEGKQPELWNPQTAEVRLLPEYRSLTQTTQMPMTLQPYESAFVVFRSDIDASAEKNRENFPQKEILASVDGPWIVSFQKDRKAPDQPVIFKELTDWTKNADERIKYFSGTATYSSIFKIAKPPLDRQIYIDLGSVMVMAKVKINGNYVGGVWTAPYRLNITSNVKKGKNEVEIEVVNNWMNRLIRDKNLPESDRITWQTFSYWKSDSPLQASGLLGPVEIQAYKYNMK